MGSDPLVIGADVGGTSSKVVLCDVAGAVLGRGKAAGGNLRSSIGDPAGNIAEALHAALDGHDPGRVVAGMIGMAGSTAVPDRARRLADTAWQRAGLPGAPQIGTDLDIAYAAGADHGDGVLLLAGTGAVAAAFHGYRMTRRCDGLGWLLGDEGSAVWLGLAGVRAAAAARDGRGPQTTLTGLLADRLTPAEPTGDPRQDIVAVAYQLPPAQFGEFAPVVTGAARDGDLVAGRIVADAAAALVRTARVAAADDPVRCLVLAGSVLTTEGPVADAVRTGLGDTFDQPPVVAADPVAGAVLHALRHAGLPVASDLPTRLRTHLAR